MRDRIKEFRRVPARELLANKKNWQRHPERQRAALQAIVAEVGFASAVVACETPGGLVLIDGHARVEGAQPDDLLPTLVLDVDAADADKLLAAMDAIAKMAERDDVALAELLESVTFEDANLRRMVADLDALHAGELEAPVEGELECALALRPHEHYDYLVVLARTTREWNILCDLLQIGSSIFDKGRGRTKIGFGRAISADKVIERLHRE
jgi:hypothetical protein